MYLGSVEVFRCNYCDDQKTVNSGLPKHWIWVKTGGPIKHACESCKDKVPRENRRESGQIN